MGLALLLKVIDIHIGAAELVEGHIVRIDELAPLLRDVVAAGFIMVKQLPAGQAPGKGDGVDDIQLRFKGVGIVGHRHARVALHEIDEHRAGIGPAALLFFADEFE